MVSRLQTVHFKWKRQIQAINTVHQIRSLLHISRSSSTKLSTMTLSLPYGDIDRTLRALAGQAEGFGRCAIGGLRGPIYHVTTLADAGPGSLRDGCRNKEPLWIIFDVSGTIELSSYLSISSYKTIDGRGQRIRLSGKGLSVKESEHVIICNLEFAEGGPDSDAIQIKPRSKHVWIDRCSLSDYDDGLIDITRASTDITVSRLDVTSQSITRQCSLEQTLLTRATDGTESNNAGGAVTVNVRCSNGSKFSVQIRLESTVGSFKSVLAQNCDIPAEQQRLIYKGRILKDDQSLESYGKLKLGGVVLVVGNLHPYLQIKGSTHGADKEEACSGCVESNGDLFISDTEAGLLTTATTESSSGSFHPSEYYPAWTVEVPTDELKHHLTHFTGWQCIPLPPDDI
ncbi:hypothetical protein LguiA_016189 [Lonicera macranthoides]